jgi:uncharacterized protein YybS (DUF2232 family)
MKKQVRTVTEGAMMLAIVGVFLYINRVSGAMLDGVLAFVMPLPAIFYIAKYGIKQGLILSFSMAIIGLILATPISLFYVMTAIVVGLVYGYGINKDKDNGWLLIWTTILTAISFFIEMVLLAKMFGYDFNTEVSTLVITLKEMGVTNLPANIETLVISIYPMAMLMAAFAQALITHIFSIILLKRLKIKTRSMKPLSQIILPRKFAYVLSVGLFTNILMTFTKDITIQIVLTNIATFSMLMFCVDAYILVLIISKLAHKPWLSLLAILIFLMMPFIGVSIGLFDSFTDLRKRVLYTYAKPAE